LGIEETAPLPLIHQIAAKKRSRKLGFRQEVFSETELPVYAILGNPISTTAHALKPYM
jgi:hypothetical protein